MMLKKKVVLIGCFLGILVGGVFAYLQKDHDAYQVVVKERMLFQEPELELFNVLLKISGKNKSFPGLEGDWSLNKTFSDSRKLFLEESRLAKFTDYIDFHYLPATDLLMRDQQITLRVERTDKERDGMKILQEFLNFVKKNHRAKTVKLFGIYKEESNNFLNLYRTRYKNTIEINENQKDIENLKFNSENFIVFDKVEEIRAMPFFAIPWYLIVILSGLIFSILSLLLYQRKN
tara:strand:- start:3603 stop:4301 length:699 start_codon:yes stop_codon:yes gene_type:complete